MTCRSCVFCTVTETCDDVHRDWYVWQCWAKPGEPETRLETLDALKEPPQCQEHWEGK